jgi:hypothetical protein
MLGEKGVDFNRDAAGNILHITNKRMTPVGQQYFVYYYIHENIVQRTARLNASYTAAGDKASLYATPFYAGLGTIKDPTASMPPIQIYLDKKADIDALCAEYFLKIAVGALPVSAFDEFLTKFRALGGNDVINAVNQWYTTGR